MRIVFVATGDVALPSFRQLLDRGPKPLALVTQPDKPVGRKQVLTPPKIKVEAEEAGIAVLQPETIDDATDQLKSMNPEVIVVMAYGQILRDCTLTIASKAIINLHASLLPKYRGAACIQAAIDAGDLESGVTAMHVVRKLDAGDMILSKSIPIAKDETGGSLHDRLADLAAEVMMETLEKIDSGNDSRVPQDPSQVSYIGKLNRDAGKLDWSMTAVQLERRIRAYDPWPGTYVVAIEAGKEKRLKIFPPTVVTDRAIEPGVVELVEGRLLVGTGAGSLELTLVQPDGGKRMPVSEYLRGRQIEAMR